MNPLLISGFGTSINVDKRKLIITNKLKKEKLEFYPHKIDHDSIIIDGHTGNISFEAMRWTVKHGINLSLLNWNGNLLSVTLPEEPKSGGLKIKQYQKYLDDSFRKTIATKIIQTKVDHSLSLLEQLSNYYDVDYLKIKQSFEKETRGLDANSDRIYSDLMTYEGRIAQIYFEQISKIINKIVPEFRFNVRKNKAMSRNYNASDEVNALFNYGYAILESEIRKSVNAVGLDSTIGFLHEITPSRTPLVYDLQELFRWIIDLSIIQLLEEKKLKKSDFIVTENYNMRLREKTAKLLIEKISANFNTKVPYKGRNYYYQNVLFDNIRNLAHCISDKKIKFDFDVPKLIIQRDDTSKLREKILSLTPDDRRKLGINKSTLWYIKKNISDGKTAKIYEKIIYKLNYMN
ncbi:CRISPR-associated endonuclease Cas1 [Nitrosopumilus sp.]|uniref:CRISPR-associated endonuclease Cas1 n=1 Tax=Nitrosopumilus sp. TaxID=2024843 RepID=UPI00247C1E28|nr:CRISPR-associated endonuclease Cas1 [Nitrosopumilus sp.]MCV0411172.1 CRISPR-associated endonuclease Cas1 [Nitrosopumilus sp.]